MSLNYKKTESSGYNAQSTLGSSSIAASGGNPSNTAFDGNIVYNRLARVTYAEGFKTASMNATVSADKSRTIGHYVVGKRLNWNLCRQIIRLGYIWQSTSGYAHDHERTGCNKNPRERQD